MLSKAECTKTTFPFLFQYSLNILWNVLSLNAECVSLFGFFKKSSIKIILQGSWTLSSVAQNHVTVNNVYIMTSEKAVICLTYFGRHVCYTNLCTVTCSFQLRYEMNIVRTMMLEEVAMENWPKTSEWLRAPSWKPTPLACWIWRVLPKVCKPAFCFFFFLNQALINVSTELEALSWFSS